MTSANADKVFGSAVSTVYETLLVPLLFEPYAEDMVKRLAPMKPSSILEVAAGTGAVTRALAAALPASTSIIATDLNQAMLDQAIAVGIARPVEWRQADAMQLPFADAMFDAVVCQFGVMFFPDKPKAYAEARRVLRPGGVFIFNVWDRIEENEFSDTITRALEPVFPDDPPRFLPRTPYAYHDDATIKRDLSAGGFAGDVQIDTVAARARADSPRGPAIAFCQGTPLRTEIEAHGAGALERATDAAAEAIAAKFGRDAVEGTIQAKVVTVTAPR